MKKKSAAKHRSRSRNYHQTTTTTSTSNANTATSDSIPKILINNESRKQSTEDLNDGKAFIEE